jgi:PAS domain S-box-containing protein
MTNPFQITREERIRFQAFMDLANSFNEIVWTAEPNGQLDYYNRYWFKYTGMTTDQSQGAGWTNALHPDDVQKCVEIWTNALTSLQPLEVEFRLRRADGTYLYHVCRANPIFDANGKISKWFGMSVNVHAARMRAEHVELRHQQEVAALKYELVELQAKLSAIASQSLEFAGIPNVSGTDP